MIKYLFCVALLIVNGQTDFSQHIKPPANLDSYNMQLLPRYSAELLDSVVRFDFTVTMRDGVVLDCLKYIPINSPPVHGWPSVIMCHGFGNSKETLAKFCRAQAQFGYYVMTYSMRGQGNSSGVTNLISTDDMLDLMEIVNYVKRDTLSGSNRNQIIVMGGSQGGLVPFMAACNGMQVNAVISALAPPNFASSWIENGSIKMTLLWSLSYPPDTVRYSAAVSRYPVWIYADNKEKWDSLAAWLPQGRDFMNVVHNCSVPIIVEGSWQDKFFNASGIYQAVQNLNTPFQMYLGAVVGHGGDSSITENQWHMTFFNNWFYRWLFNYPPSLFDTVKYQYASTTYPYLGYAWTFVHAESSIWPLPTVQDQRFYFNRNNRLTSTADLNTGDFVTLANPITGGLTMQEAVDEAFTGVVFNSNFTKNTLVFDSDPLTSNLQWIGTPRVNLNYSSSGSTFCQFNFQIYDVKPDSSFRFVNRINYTDRNYIANTNKTVAFDGQTHSHIFQAGDKIRVIVTNLDTAPGDSSFLATNPFVLPVLINENNTIDLNSNSYIDLPIKTTLNGIIGNTQNVPSSFELKQNYPNPFNPGTTIKYNLPLSSHVELKVYDITGRLVKTLVNDQQETGSYSIIFDGVNLASGIYFYQITINTGTTGFHDVKRMVLLK
jgi:predicted acyl esterase